jgi:hypothetical protein
MGIGRVVLRGLLIGGSCRLEYRVGANNGAACAGWVYTFASWYETSTDPPDHCRGVIENGNVASHFWNENSTYYSVTLTTNDFANFPDASTLHASYYEHVWVDV